MFYVCRIFGFKKRSIHLKTANTMGSKVNKLEYLLVVVFGSSSWLSTNSIWMELPLLVAELPEGWSLPSYLAVIVQLAVVGPLGYSVVRKCIHKELKPAPVIAGMLAFGCVCTVLLALLWNQTSLIAGESRSVALFLAFFGLALVNCTSNVLFMPYMATFHHTYLTAYFVGMGLSALFPSIVSLIQGAGRYNCISAWNNETSKNETMPEFIPAWFGVTVYNFIMFLWMFVALVSFVLLHWAKMFNKQTDKNKNYDVVEENEASPLNTASNQDDARKAQLQNGSAEGSDDAHGHQAHLQLSLMQYIVLLLLTAWVCALMNGVLPSIQSYASLPYGQTVYHLALTLSNIANPIACFVPFFVRVRSITVLSSLTLAATVFSAYTMLLAALSPNPILLHSVWGSVFCIVAAVLALGVQAYLRTAMAGMLREGAEDSEARLFWCGVFTQLGSFVGAIAMFPLVNIAHVFQSAPQCRND